MSNSARSSVSYKPRLSDEEAYERLPITLKRCLQEAVTEWSSYWVLKHFEKHGLAKTIDTLHWADRDYMRKGFQMKRFEKATQSSFVACKVEPLRIYGITRTTRINQGQH